MYLAEYVIVLGLLEFMLQHQLFQYGAGATRNN